MSYFPPPPPNQGDGYSVGFYPPPNQPGGYNPAPYGNMPSEGNYNRPGPFPTDHFEMYPTPGGYADPGQYPPPNQYQAPGQYPPPNQYQAPGPGYGLSGYGGPPIMTQPDPRQVGGDWMSMPQGLPNCPPGLEYLMSLSSLFVKQKVEFLEAITGFETNNKFTIKNDRGEKLYWAVEESDMCSRNCFGRQRPFEMRVMDSYQNEVIHLNRPFNCQLCCLPFCLQKMEVYAPPGNLVGTIEEEWSLFIPQFKIKDATGETVLRIEGSCCGTSLCGHVEFQILSKDGQVTVGKISKEWSGFMRELFTDADYFGISFPMDLDVKMKAVMLGALFLIDAMMFESNQ